MPDQGTMTPHHKRLTDADRQTAYRLAEAGISTPQIAAVLKISRMHAWRLLRRHYGVGLALARQEMVTSQGAKEPPKRFSRVVP
jgi:hypothetical protein